MTHPITASVPVRGSFTSGAKLCWINCARPNRCASTPLERHFCFGTLIQAIFQDYMGTNEPDAALGCAIEEFDVA